MLNPNEQSTRKRSEAHFNDLNIFHILTTSIRVEDSMLFADKIDAQSILQASNIAVWTQHSN